MAVFSKYVLKKVVLGNEAIASLLGIPSILEVANGLCPYLYHSEIGVSA
ncbi:hypothetical protein [[Leptolyngbya] sp. PCC 7376]|nr:hypothetical protein [[Leptolyngbya] sp. PCC 7376]